VNAWNPESLKKLDICVSSYQMVGHLLFRASDYRTRYSIHPKPGPPGFRMAISRTLLVSGIRMASLDRFHIHYIYIYIYIHIKRSRLRPFETRTQKSGFRMVLALTVLLIKGHKKYFIHAKTV
jgi:hypothetical protein